jgi:hypothetical protein
MSLCERGQKCSCWFDGIKALSLDWSSACQIHDRRYMTAVGYLKTRKECDVELMENVYNCSQDHKKILYVISKLMYVGVRAFGFFYWSRYELVRNMK